MTDVLPSPHLSEAEIAAVIYAVGQNRDLERRAYSHLAICSECTQLVGSLRDADRETSRLLASLDVAAPSQSADSIIRAAHRHEKEFAFGWRRAAAVVGFVVVAGAAAAAFPGSPVHRLLVGAFGSSGDQARFTITQKTPTSEPVSPAVSLAAAPGSALEVAFSGIGVGGALDVQVIDVDQISLSSASADAIYRVSTSRIAVEQSAPATFHLQVPRSLRSLRVRVGTRVVFDRRPGRSGEDSFTIQLTRPNAAR